MTKNDTEKRDADSTTKTVLDGVVRTQTDLAKHLNVARRTVVEWTNERNPPPRQADGSYILTEVQAWHEARKARLRKPVDERREELNYRKEETKLRKETALAMQAEFKAKRMDPDFVPVVDVNQFLTSFFTELRRNALAIPPEMCATYPTEVRELVQGDLESRLKMLLNYAADWVENWQPEVDL